MNPKKVLAHSIYGCVMLPVCAIAMVLIIATSPVWGTCVVLEKVWNWTKNELGMMGGSE